MKFIDANLLELLITVVVSAGAFLFLRVWNGIADTQKKFDEIINRISQLELRLVGEYTPKSHHDQIANAIFTKLDKLADEIHRIDHTKEDRLRRND